MLDQVPRCTTIRHGLQALFVIRYDVRLPLLVLPSLSSYAPLVLFLAARLVTLLRSETTSPPTPLTPTNLSTMVELWPQLSPESLANLAKAQYN